MKYNTYLILFSILLFDCQVARGQEQRYRVEILVLRHLEGHSTVAPVPLLRDFSTAMDLLAPPVESPMSETAAQPEVPATNPPGVQPADQAAAPVVLLEERSEVMAQAWRRLHSADGLRPELYLSWEQAASAGSPEIRIHDNEVVFEPDSYTSLQDATAFQSGHDTRAPGDARALVRYFRLDGTARLRVSRFLHLDLDIELRETAEGEPQSAALQQEPGQTVDGALPPKAYAVHAIRQSRQLQLENLQYFDGPVIAVLALVSRVEPLPESVQ
jgi:Peptidoglycan-binding protein, CsiV